MSSPILTGSIMPRMDIKSGVIALVALAALFAVLSIRSALRTLQAARKMTFYRLRRQRETGAWRLLGLAAVLVVFAVVLPMYGLPIAYQYFPPSPTASLTPSPVPFRSVTPTPTITLTATVTDTPLVTDTPTITMTPSLPLAVEALFQSSITPNPDTVLSSLTFSTTIENEQAVDPQTVFDNPIQQIFATYSYTNMVPGSQWTALWLRDGKQVCLETHPFAGGTGGYDDASCSAPAGGWQPGVYETQIFVGQDIKVVGKFLVQGTPPTEIPSLTPTPSRTPTLAPTVRLTPLPAASQVVTRTP